MYTCNAYMYTEYLWKDIQETGTVITAGNGIVENQELGNRGGRKS